MKSKKRLWLCRKCEAWERRRGFHLIWWDGALTYHKCDCCGAPDDSKLFRPIKARVV